MKSFKLIFYLVVFSLALVMLSLARENGQRQAAGDPMEESINGSPSHPTWEERILSEGTVKVEDFNVDFIGHWPFGATRAVAVSGDIAYVGSGGGVLVVNISKSDSPTLLAELKTPGIVYDLFVSESLLCIAGFENGLLIADISTPSAPSLIGSSDTPGLACGVSAGNNYAWVADGESGLRTIDISDPASPVETGHLNTPGSAEDVVISGDRAFVADGSGGLRIIDVSNPFAPREIGWCDAAGPASGVTLVGDYACLAADDFVVINVADPGSLYVVARLNTSGTAKKLSHAGDHVYLVDGGTMQTIDMSIPETPAAIGSYAVTDYAFDAAVQGQKVYVSDGGYGLHIVDVSNPAVPFRSGFFDTPAYARDVAAQGHFAYIADGRYGGLRILDVTHPGSPVPVGSHETPGPAQGIDVSGTYAYIADGFEGGLQIFDVSNPASPFFVNKYPTSGNTRDVTVRGTLAYIADGESGLLIVDISNPYIPVFVGQHDVSSRAYQVAVAGDYAYVADWQYGLRIFDVSNPLAPILSGLYPTPDYAYGVAVRGDLVCLADGNTGLLVLDISKPASPVYRGTYDTNGYSLGVTMDDRYAYIAYENNGLHVVDLFYPDSPVLAGCYDTPGRSFGVSIADGYTYVVDFQCGFTVLEFTPCTYTLLSPNGGEAWTLESTHAITWTSRQTSGTVSIALSTDGGTSWGSIVSQTPDDGFYSWEIPLTISDNCLIRMTDAEDTTCIDFSDAPFSIFTPCQIELTSPVGGESWCAGEIQTISWVSDSTGGKVRLDYSTDGGARWLTITALTADDGAFSWIPPAAPLSACLVRISDAYYPGCRDRSDSSFAVCAPPQAAFAFELSSRGSDTCVVRFKDESTGCVTDWEWNFGDGETSREQHPVHTFHCGSALTVSLTTSGPCGVSTEKKDDVVDCPCPCAITLLSPDGGEDWCAGDTADIAWTSVSTSGTIRIDYSTDGGSSWMSVTGSEPDDGFYSWLVPDISSNVCRIRISDTSRPDCADTSLADFQLCRCGTVTLLTDSPAAGTRGCPYTATLQAAGGCIPYTWTVMSGTVPSGLHLYGSSGILSGTPLDTGTVRFTVKVTDAFGSDETAEMILEIGEYVQTRGDVNGECTLDILDIVLAVNILLERMDPTDEEFLRADCNGPAGNCDGDGTINVLDALKIANLILYLDECP